MSDSLYKKMQDREAKSEQEMFRLTQERMKMEGKKSQEIPDKLDSLISQNESNINSNKKWYKKPVGIIVISVIGGLIVLFLKKRYGL